MKKTMAELKRKIVPDDELREICTTRLHKKGATDFVFHSVHKLPQPDPDSGCNWTWAWSQRGLLIRITTTELDDAAYAEALSIAEKIALEASLEFNIK